METSTAAAEAHTLDFTDYVESLGGTYLPFPAAVELVYFWQWAESMWKALKAGIRPPADRVALLLSYQPEQKAYLPPWIAVDYPDVPNPHGKTT